MHIDVVVIARMTQERGMKTLMDQHGIDIWHVSTNHSYMMRRFQPQPTTVQTHTLQADSNVLANNDLFVVDHGYEDDDQSCCCEYLCV